MNRKIISALLALVLCFSFALSVSAEPKAIDFVVDECGYLADGELEALNNLASSICEETGVGIFYVFTTAETMEDYDIACLTGGMEDYIIMNENPQNEAAADIVVYYDNTPNDQKFLVTTTDVGMGAISISTDEFFSECYKYSTEIISGILYRVIPEGGNFLVLFTNRAMNAIHLLCDSNRLSF